MDKTVKNVLAAVGAVALVKAAPLLAAGVAIGAVVSNPEKFKKAAEDFASRLESNIAKCDMETWLKEEMERNNARANTPDENKPEPESASAEEEEVAVEESNSVPEEVHDETDVADDDENDLTPTEAGNWSPT